MKKIIINSIFMLMMGFSFNGCQLTNYFNSTPKCSDDNVQSLVKDIYINMLENAKDNILLNVYMSKAPQSISSLSSIRAISFDKEVNLRECKAVANFDDDSNLDLEYSVQIAEDGNDFYVEFKEDFVEKLMTQSIMSNMMQ